jgi:hypothetical protein
VLIAGCDPPHPASIAAMQMLSAERISESSLPREDDKTVARGGFPALPTLERATLRPRSSKARSDQDLGFPSAVLCRALAVSQATSACASVSTVHQSWDKAPRLNIRKE